MILRSPIYRQKRYSALIAHLPALGAVSAAERVGATRRFFTILAGSPAGQRIASAALPPMPL